MTSFNIQGGLDDDFLTVSYYSEDQDRFFNFFINPFNGANTYTNATIDFYDPNSFSTSLESVFNGTSNVTVFGEVGEYIDINFNGVIADFNTSDEIPVSGTVHVLRDY